MIALFNYLIIFNVFAGAFVLSNVNFEFYLGYTFILAFLMFYLFRYRKIHINSSFIIIVAILTLTTLINAHLGKTTIFLMLKQVLGILLTGIAYYLLVKINDYNINKLFKIYLRIAVVVAAIGIFQELSFLIKFKYGYDYSWFISKWGIVPGEKGLLRINSIFYEPSHYAITMAPAFFIALFTVMRNNTNYLNKKAAFLLIVSYILTFSAVGYIAIFISLVLIFLSIKKFKYGLATTILIPLLILASYRFIPDIRMRVDDATKVLTCSMKATESHLSVYAITSNAYVAYKSFMDSPLFGRGLGSHPISFDTFIRSGTANGLWRKDVTVANKNDAASLFLRLLSETGLFGIAAIFYFLLKFHLRICENKDMQIMNNAILVLFILQLLRQGHYFYNGLFFFVWLYYFSYKIEKKHYHISC